MACFQKICGKYGILCVMLDENMSEINAVGTTAFITNCLRAIHGGFTPPLDDGLPPNALQYIRQCVKIRSQVPPLFFDGFSARFVNKFTYIVFEKLAASPDMYAFLGITYAYVGFRTVFMDAQVKEAHAKGIKQIVYLGVGLDTRALRLYFPGVSVWECDQSASVEYKMKKMALLGFPQYPAKFIKGNFMEIDVVAQLQQEKLDCSAPTLFVWEGNSMYLPVETNTKLLNTIFGKIPQALIAFDSVGPAPGATSEFFKTIEKVLGKGKPMYPGRFLPMDMAASVGARLVMSKSPPDFWADALGNQQKSMSLNFADPQSDEAKFKEVYGNLSFNVMVKK